MFIDVDIGKRTIFHISSWLEKQEAIVFKHKTTAVKWVTLNLKYKQNTISYFHINAISWFHLASHFYSHIYPFSFQKIGILLL